MSQSLPPEPPLSLADLRHRYDRTRFIPLLLTASVLAHEILFLGWIFYRQHLQAMPASNPEPMPLEFVALDDPAVTVPNPETNRIAQQANQGGASTGADRPSIARTQSTTPQPNLSAIPGEAPQPPSFTAATTTNPTELADPSTAVESLPLSDSGWAEITRDPAPVSSRSTPARPPQPLRPTSAALGSGSLSAQSLNPYSQRLQNDRGDLGSGVTARADVDWGPYTAQLQRQVEAQWQPKADFESEVEVAFEIDRRGNVHDLQVIRSSGDAVTDVAAKVAVAHAAPFGTFPLAYRDDRIAVTFTFTVNVVSISQ